MNDADGSIAAIGAEGQTEGQLRGGAVDPKGLRNLEGRTDPKIGFHQTIKELESRLADPEVTLASFIVSNIPYIQVKWWSDGMTKEEFEACNVLFKPDDRESYISTLLKSVIGEAQSANHHRQANREETHLVSSRF